MRNGSIWKTIGDAVRPGTTTAHMVNIVFIPVLAILVLLLPPFSVLARITGGGGENSASTANVITLGPGSNNGSSEGLTVGVKPGVLDADISLKIQRDPKELKDSAMPQSVSAASAFYKLTPSKPADAAVNVEIDLDSPAPSGDQLDVFVQTTSSWEWAAGATLSEDGRKAKASIRSLPSALVVGRIAPQQPAIAAWVPPSSGVDTVARDVLSVVNPMWHSVNDDGSLTGPLTSLPDGKFKVYPTIQNIVDGSVKGDIVNHVLSSDDVRKRHVANIVALAKQNYYAGVDINYQGIDPSLRDKYTAFITDLASALHQEGRFLSIVLPLPQKSGDGWNTGAYDWYALGKAADYVAVSAERDQSLYTSTTPDVLAYATSQIDRRKVNLVVSTFSHEKSKSGIRDLSAGEALNIASKVDVKGSPNFLPGDTVTFFGSSLLSDVGGSGLSWNKDTKTVAFSYAASDGQRTVWIENVLSLAYKLQYAKQFNLRGVSVQNIGDSAADKSVSSLLQTFKTNGSVQLTEPSGQSFTVAWQSSDGSLSASGASWVNWTIPNNPGGRYTVTLTVGDGVATTVGSKTFAVAIPPTPTSTTPPKPTATSVSQPTSQPTQAPPTPQPTPVPVVAPGGAQYPGVGYGMQVDQGTNLPKAVQLLRGAGFDWAKVQIRWESVETSKGNINWGYLDSIVNLMSANGVRLLFSITASPKWAQPPDYTAGGPPANPQDLADFVGAIARHYPGKVQAYEIWNEMNVFYEWGGMGRRLNAAKYVDLLKVSYAAIKAADPSAVVLSGGLTPTGVNDGDIAYDDVVYMDMLYQAGVKDYSDAVAVHGNVIYPYGPDETVATRGGHGSFYFRRFEELHAVMAKYGDGDKQMWFTEFGWPSSPIPLKDYQFANQINESQQAEWIVRAFEIGKEKGYVGPMFLFNLNFAPSVQPDDPIAMAAFCILHRDWSPRPAYNAVAAMPK